MLLSSDARILQSSVNSLVSLVFVTVFASGAALLIWHAASGQNPVADLLAVSVYTN